MIWVQEEILTTVFEQFFVVFLLIFTNTFDCIIKRLTLNSQEHMLFRHWKTIVKIKFFFTIQLSNWIPIFMILFFRRGFFPLVFFTFYFAIGFQSQSQSFQCLILFNLSLPNEFLKRSWFLTQYNTIDFSYSFCEFPTS